MSLVEAELGRWDRAEEYLLQITPSMNTDPKIGLMIEGALAWLHAGLGRREPARNHLARAEARLADFPDERSTRLGVLALLGRAALLLDDHALAEHLWLSFFDAGPYPGLSPTGFYYLGEARLGLGQVDGARVAFERAVALEIDTHHARLARRRLDSGPGRAAGGVAAGPAGPLG
jgi:hypothetical protein